MEQFQVFNSFFNLKKTITTFPLFFEKLLKYWCQPERHMVLHTLNGFSIGNQNFVIKKNIFEHFLSIKNTNELVG